MGSQDERESDHRYWRWELDKLNIAPDPGEAPAVIKLRAHGEHSSGETRWLLLPDDVFAMIAKVLRGDEVVAVLDENSIRLLDRRTGREIVAWTRDQWEADPSLILPIVTAVLIGHTRGSDALLAVVDHPTATNPEDRT